MGVIMIKKIALFLIGLLVVQTACWAKDTLNFTFPNEGWHRVVSPDGVASKVCYVPYNQSSTSYTEMLTFIEKNMKHVDMSPAAILHRQLGKDKNNYKDIYPEYVVQDAENAIVTWCSKTFNTCAVERAFRGKQGIVLVIYTNKAPHYSQNMFGQWVNNLGRIEVYDPEKTTENQKVNLIEL